MSGSVHYCETEHETRLCEIVPDPGLRYLVAAVVDVVRERGCTIESELRLSDTRRLRYRCSKVDGGKVELRIDGTRREILTLLTNLSVAKASGEVLLHVCSWCKSVRGVGGNWIPVEDGLQSLDLSPSSPLPTLSHGVCPSCFDGVYSHLMRPRAPLFAGPQTGEQLALLSSPESAKSPV
jgi:hypothetical protein